MSARSHESTKTMQSTDAPILSLFSFLRLHVWSKGCFHLHWRCINYPSLQSVTGIFRDVSPWWFEILSDWLSRLFITACVYVFAADVDVYKISKNMWLWWEAVCFLRSIVMEQDLLRHCLPSSKLLKSFRQQVSNHINLWLFY